MIAIIVPVLNEADTLPGLLEHLHQLAGEWELIISDGGSTDRSREIALTHPAAPQVLDAPRGRASQMNAAAGVAHAPVLVFLHADTRLAPDAHARLLEALRQPGVDGGNFSIRFDGQDLFSRVLGRWYALQRRTGVYYGDSVLWVRAERFHELGGFRALAVMEDYDFARRLERTSQTRCLPGPVVSSSRRWTELGVLRTALSWTVIRWLFILGIPDSWLARLYRRRRLERDR